MSVRQLVYEGDPRLREKAIKIRKVDHDLQRLASDMFDTMHAENGVGLAGPQVGVMRRIIVIGIPEGLENDDDPAIELALVNPEIVRSSGHQLGPEGCLSIPNWYGDVARAMNVTVKARDLDDRDVRIKASGYLARTLQHEIDHLDGILFIDRIEDKSKLYHVSEDDDDVDDDLVVTAN